MSTEHEDERGSVTRSALSRLTGTTGRDFLDRYWGVAPKLTRAVELTESGDGPHGFDDLMSAYAVDELISERGVRTPFARMAKDGSVLDRSAFTASGGFGAEVTDQLDSAAVLSAFADGHTLVLQGLHRLWPPLIEFVGDLAREIGHPAQVNSYVTPAASQGFSPHYDVHDVFVVQISGRKKWTLHRPVHLHPLNNQPWSDRRSEVETRAKEDPHLDVVLEPGDVLYLPRGWIHSAQALGDTTIHLTIGVAAFNDYDVAHQVLGELRSHADMRRPLPAGVDLTDTASVEPHVRRVLEDMRSALDAIADDPQAIRRLAEGLGTRFTELVSPVPVRPLATVTAMGALSGEHSVVLRTGLAVRVEKSDRTVSISTRGKTVTLPGQCAAAVEQLAIGKPCRVGELPGLDIDDALVVTRRLIREAVLTVVP